MGLTLYLEIKRGKIACHKSEARSGTLLREGRLVSRASRDEAFWRSQVNFGPPNPATDEKALWSKGKRRTGRTQQSDNPGADSPPTGGGETAISRHITTYEQDRRDTGRQPNPIESRRIHSTCGPRTSYSTFFKSRGRDLFSAMKKRSRFDSAQPNDTSNTNDPRSVARSPL
ncbi:unnamed protein product [Dovyalis caffra]|uniref:Uncharacterized protein n=1 Tax=Dovyalis caffra TaxID=77055 RepID=A0AAV1R4D9_9ROSI|nr:unnamed protein product [Dovyalis caffra]